MQLKEVMHKDTPVVAPEMTLREAARLLSENDRQMLPVCRSDEVIGVLTLRDLTVRATAQGCDPDRSKVREVMTRDVPCCFENQDIREAAGIMRGRQVGMLLVMDLNRRLVGTVSSNDLKPGGKRPRWSPTCAGETKENG